MPTYKYLNANHSLALRDQTIIAWHPSADMPLEVAEQAVWAKAGSPTPTGPEQQLPAELRQRPRDWGPS